MKTFSSYIETRLDEADAPPGGAPPGGAPPMGAPPMGGGAPPMGAPPMGGGAPPMGGGAGGGAVAPTKPAKKIKSHSLWSAWKKIFKDKDEKKK